MKTFTNFFKETWHRIFGESPSYFSVIQKISIAVTALSGLPLLLQQFQAQTHFVVPDFMVDFSNKIFFFCGIVAFIISKLPVSNPGAIKVKDDGEIVQKLPFTKQK